MTQSQKFNEAWRISKAAHKSYGFYGSVKQYFSEALKLVNKLGKVAILTPKQKLIVNNCLSGARILSLSYAYISDSETKVFAKTTINGKVLKRTYYFDHNRTSLMVINN